MINDLRRNDFYLTDIEKEEWDNRNILYNTIWFYLNKGRISKFPDIEYCDAAISAYKKLECYKECKIIYHTNSGKVLISRNGKVLSADLMTGWWNPVSYYLGWSNRKFITENLLNSIPSENNDSVVVSWLVKKIEKDCASAKALLEFLKFIYTEGNIIPAPVNWKGRGIDAWPYKLKEIKEGKLDDAVAWKEYIRNTYEDFNDFIEQNKLQMYIKNEKIVSFWNENNEPRKWTEATDDQWKDYFTNAKSAIEDRCTRINSYF